MLTLEQQFMVAEAAMYQLKIDFINDINNNINYYYNIDGNNKSFYYFYDYDDELNITDKILTLFNTFNIELKRYIIINNNNYIRQ